MAKHEIQCLRSFRGEPVQVAVYTREALSQEANFALRLLDKAQLLGADDGEDTAGRAKAREKTVDELVSRAFDIAEASFRIARERGLMIDLPSLAEADEIAKASADKN